MSLPIEIYTDGSLKLGRGAWAYVVVRDGTVVQEQAGTVMRTTALRMELQAAIEALMGLPFATSATLYSDSKIMIDAMNGVGKDQHPGPNGDLIRQLDNLNKRHQITWHWVRAHSGVLFNERCDQLCRAYLQPSQQAQTHA